MLENHFRAVPAADADADATGDDALDAAGVDVAGAGASLGETAHASPTATKSAPPRAGSHIGVVGSPASGGAIAAFDGRG
jgi:hypothetical protein